MRLRFTPTSITLSYLIFSSAWVLLGDNLLGSLHLSAGHIELLQSAKGLAFVLLSSLLLGLMLHAYNAQHRRIRRTLRGSQQRLKLALEAAEFGHWDWHLGNQEAFFSTRYCRLLGVDELTSNTWIERIHPDDLPAFRRDLRQAADHKNEVQFHSAYRLRHADGQYRWIESFGKLLHDDNNQPERLIGIASDITQRRNDEHLLRQAAAVFEATQEGVLVTNAALEIVHINPTFSRITGYDADEVLGKSPTVLKSGRHDAAFYEALWQDLSQKGSWSGEIWNRRKSGEVYPQWQSIRSIHDAPGQLTHYVAVFSDISLLHRSQIERDHLAHFDPLTELPNRLLFSERVQHALTRAKRLQRGGAVLIVNIDHFKLINEGLGHNTGDALLKAVAKRFLDQLESGVTLARLASDEFGLVFEGSEFDGLAVDLADKLLRSLDTPFALADQTLYINASIGIYEFCETSCLEQVVRNANSALHKAKSNGRQGVAVYSRELTDSAQQRFELAHALRHAIQNNQLVVHYQPLHSLHTGQLIGAEALVRWQHPERGLLSPGVFIPIAEETGMIGEIDAWVLNQASLQLAEWSNAGLELPRMAVNVSSRLLYRPGLHTKIAALLESTRLDPARLELEVTESAVMQDPALAQEHLHKLRALGINLSIDDFGTGYSSLARLKRLPVNKLKLDRSFVQGLPHDKDDQAIARAVIGLGHSLGMQVLAEGIEHLEQAEFLKACGCDSAQGYLFGRPMPAPAFAEQLSNLKREQT